MTRFDRFDEKRNPKSGQNSPICHILNKINTQSKIVYRNLYDYNL